MNSFRGGSFQRAVCLSLVVLLLSSIGVVLAKKPGPSTVNVNLEGSRLYVDFHFEWSTGHGCDNIHDFEKVYQHSGENRENANQAFKNAVQQAIQAKSGSSCTVSDFTVEMSWDDEGGSGGVILGYTVYEAVHFYLSGAVRSEGGDTVIDMRWRSLDAGDEQHFQSHLGQRGFDPDCIFLFDFTEAPWTAPLTQWTRNQEDGKVILRHKADFKLNNELTGAASRDAITLEDLEFTLTIDTDKEVELSSDEIRIKGLQTETAGFTVPEWALYGGAGVIGILVLGGVAVVLRRRPKPEATVTVEKAAPKGKKFCINCGATIPRKAKYCHECGKTQE